MVPRQYSGRMINNKEAFSSQLATQLYPGEIFNTPNDMHHILCSSEYEYSEESCVWPLSYNFYNAVFYAYIY